MKNRLIYVELKSGFEGNGPAWIGEAGTSKSGATIYSNGKAFRSQHGGGISSNYFDIETLDSYWISGIKKNNQDRHWSGRGSIEIDVCVIDRYLAEMGLKNLPKNLVPAALKPNTQTPAHADIERESVAQFHDRTGHYYS